MALVQGSGKANDNGPQMEQRKPSAIVQGKLLDPNMREWVCTYRRGDGKLETKTLLVPKFLVAAIHNPGEQGMDALSVMHGLSSFFSKEVAVGLESVNLGNGLDVPASILSALIHRSYEVHAHLAAADRKHAKELFLDDPEVKRLMRIVASNMTGKPLAEIVELDPEKTLITVTETKHRIVQETPGEDEGYMSRKVTKTTQKPTVKLETKTMQCECGSHTEPREVSVPVGASVETSQVIREERIRRMPDVGKSLENVFDKIEEKGSGKLDLDQRNAVVQHINLTYVENPQDRLPVIPKLDPNSGAGW